MKRRQVIIGAGGLAAVGIAGVAFTGTTAAESHATFEITGDVAIEDGVLEYIALTDYHAKVVWENYAVDIEHVQARNYLVIEGDHLTPMHLVTETVVDAVDEPGGNGEYVLFPDDDTVDFVIIGEDAEVGGHESPNFETHEPYDHNGAMDGDDLEFTINIEQAFDLLNSGDVVDTAFAQDWFTVTVDENSIATVGGGATATGA